MYSFYTTYYYSTSDKCNINHMTFILYLNFYSQTKQDIDAEKQDIETGH